MRPGRFLAGLVDRLRRALDAWAVRLRTRSLRDWAVAMGPWLVIAFGVALILFSSLAEVRRVDEVVREGLVAPSSLALSGLNRSDYTFVEFELRGFSDCSLRAYFLDRDALATFENTSELPDEGRALTCDRPRGVFQGEVALIVLRNSADGVRGYVLTAELFLISTPHSLWVLPGFAVFVAGTATVMLRLVGTGMVRLLDELDSRGPRKPFGPGGEDGDPPEEPLPPERR